MRALALLVLVTGCDRLFDLQHVDEQPSAGDAALDGTSDGRVVADAPAGDVMQTHSNCPAGFAQPFGSSVYRYVPTPVTWYDALRTCAMLDDPTSTKRVHLAVLESDIERTHVYVDVVGSAGAFWIGLSDTKVEGAYQWVTNENPTYPEASSWAVSEPSTGAADDCVLVRYSTADLDSVACTAALGFACECDGYAYAPANYTLM